jgi:lon-related putative ATP-dependent protease
MTLPSELTAMQLRRRYDPARFTYSSTAEAPDLEGIIGQERASRAIEFGLAIPYPGYNVFATGPGGAGKTSIIGRFLETKAATRPVPPDWGYVHNLNEPDQPCALRLPPGGGNRLRDQINALLNQVGAALQKMFASDQYAESRNVLERQLDQLRNDRFRQLESMLTAQDFGLTQTNMGMMVAPMRDKQPLTEEQFNALTEAERAALSEQGAALQEELERAIRQVQEFEAAARERLIQLDRDLTAATIQPFFERLAGEYADWPDVADYLAAAQAHIAEHAEDYKGSRGGPAPADTGEGAAESVPSAPMRLQPRAASPFDRYRLNVLVDNSGLSGAPVITETNPTYGNLIGRVEMRAELGTLVTDYRFIKAGALHRANGGYLLLDARVLLRQPLAWEGLKQALRNKRVRIEEIDRQAGVLATTTLTPEPIPLDVKVVLIGDPQTYYLLYAYDEQFEKLFKVRADFAVEMDWTEQNEEKIVRFIRNRCDEFGLLHFDVSAVAKVVELSARLVEDQRKLTTRFAHVSDIIQEAAFWAGHAGRDRVIAEDVQRAIDERIYRSNQFEERMREAIVDGSITVDTQGAVIGQVNGLAVLELGDYAFGRPSRITARTYQGRTGVVNIEREARMSGRIHDKGVLILSGFLGGRYAQDKPLSLSASIAFEQSYEGVDGDSASSTELYALLSSLAELPVKQGIAVTGSVDQKGAIQAIGGATAKIEGFFEICRAMPGGLTGEQGVVIPAANVVNLMLRDEVVEAVAQGKFHVWPVRTVDEGISILTGVPAGERDPDGSYPADSVNGRVDRKLRELAEKLQSFGQPNRERRNGENGPLPGVPGNGPGPEGEPEPPKEPDLPGDQPEPPGPTAAPGCVNLPEAPLTDTAVATVA